MAHSTPPAARPTAGLIALLVVYGALSAWLRWTRIRADRRGLAITAALIGKGREERIAREDVEAITAYSTMQLGNEFYYGLQITRQSGWPIIVDGVIREREEAVHLAELIERALDRRPDLS